MSTILTVLGPQDRHSPTPLMWATAPTGVPCRRLAGAQDHGVISFAGPSRRSGASEVVDPFAVTEPKGRTECSSAQRRAEVGLRTRSVSGRQAREDYCRPCSRQGSRWSCDTARLVAVATAAVRSPW